MTYITRFAPSPTGRLHIGHALSALAVWHAADLASGTVLLRIEDIDHARCRPEYEQGIYDDLHWLGLTWPEPVWRQSERLPVYAEALADLKQREIVYPCFCTRRQIAATATEHGFEGPIYPGTCRDLTQTEVKRRLDAGQTPAWRIDLTRALDITGPIRWHDAEAGRQDWDGLGWGDVVLARKDIGTSYHVAVTLDDALQQVSHIVRGQDLFHMTHIHVVLQRLFGIGTPQYQHHRLLTDPDGDKMAKRKGSQSLRALIESGLSRDDILAMISTGT